MSTTVLPGVLLGVLAGAASAAAQTTTLLEVDLESGKEKRIDGGQDEEDLALDAALADALGEGSASFSTTALDDLVKKIRNELKSRRPRSPATRLTLATPGRVDLEKLRRMKEIEIVVDLVIDPCERSLCLDSVGLHIEMVGRAVGAPEQQGGGRFKLVYGELSIRAATQFRDKEMEVFSVPMEECIEAAAESGGGRAWVDSARKQEERYEPWVSRAIARRCYRRKLDLESAPMVTRQNEEVQVVMRINGDRSRTKELVMESMAAAVEGMRKNNATPPMQHIEVQLLEPGFKPRRYQAAGPSVGQWLDGKIEVDTLWETYVRYLRKRQGASTLDFSDDDT